jgi:4-amino-4-deoxy-L-arabinose transferase-like glycosyltransferase
MECQGARPRAKATHSRVDPMIRRTTPYGILESVPVRDCEIFPSIPGHRVVLGLWLLIGVLLRLTLLERYPLPIHQDELSNTYDGWSIAQTGSDRFGSRWPFVVRGFGEPDYRPALQAWLDAASTGVLGFSTTAGRLPSALIGVVALILIYPYVRTLAGRATALVAVALAAVSPWHVLFSRLAHEGTSLPPFFVMASLLLWQRAVIHRYSTPALAMLGCCLGLMSNAYHATRLIALLLFAAAAVDSGWTTWRRTRSARRTLPRLLALGAAAGLGAFPQMWVMLTDPRHFFARAADRLLWNRPEGGPAWSYLANLLKNLAPDHLFLSFGKFNFLSIGRGLPIEVAFFYVGLTATWFVLRRTRRRSLLQLSLCLLVCNLPAALTEVGPHALRASGTSILLPVFSALGVLVAGRLLVWLVSRSPHHPVPTRGVARVWLAVFLVATALTGGMLVARYAGSEQLQGIDQQNHLVKLGEWLGKHQASYERVIMEEFGNQAYLFIAAFSGMTPAEFQSAQKTIQPEPPGYWDVCYALGKYRVLDPFTAYRDWQREGSPRWLVVTRLGRPEMTRLVHRIDSPDEPVFLSEYVPGWRPLAELKGEPVPVSALTPTKVDCAFAPPKMNRAWDDLPLVTGGVQYASGIGVHAPCALTFAVPPGVHGFGATVGLSDDVRNHEIADVVFELRDQDGRMLYDSGVLTPRDAPRRISIALEGVTSLTLVVGEGRNGRDFDHAHWVNAAFLRRVPGSPGGP